jgi:tetratricopeptide (TPR) repeat protein
MKLKAYQRALEDADIAILYDGAMTKARLRKGEALYQLGRYEEAFHTYQQAAIVDPTIQDIEAKIADARSKFQPDADSPGKK